MTLTGSLESVTMDVELLRFCLLEGTFAPFHSFSDQDTKLKSFNNTQIELVVNGP